MLLLSLILASLSLLITLAHVYVSGKRELDEIESNFEDFETLESLDERITNLEYGFKAYKTNLDALSSQLIETRSMVSDLKNQVNNATKQLHNNETAVNNLIPFIDKTRGMAEDNTKRLDNLNGRVHSNS
jgi:uncharacterized coiled-coil protein SlyX